MVEQHQNKTEKIGDKEYNVSENIDPKNPQVKDVSKLEPAKLPDDIAKKYKLGKGVSGFKGQKHICAKSRIKFTIDTLTEEQCEAMVKAGSASIVKL